jgi:hypothetical protein
MPDLPRTYRRVALLADMQKYSNRSTVLQHNAQMAFIEALDAAGSAAGLDRGSWRRQSSGDGEAAVLPGDVDEPAVLSKFLIALDHRLRRLNVALRPEARVRVRVAVNQGLIIPDSGNGFAGRAVNEAARLVDAPVLKRALDAFPEAAVACIVPDDLYHDVVTGGYDGIRPERFRRERVQLPDKGFQAWAWLQIVDEDVTKADLTGTAGSDPVRPDQPGPAPERGGIRTGDVSTSDGQTVIGHGSSAFGARGHE